MRGKSTLISALVALAVSTTALLGGPVSAAAAPIVGGSVVTESKPWISALHNNDRFVCTSTIISQRWVITAAHCVEGGGSFSVRIGSLTRSSGGTTASVSRVVSHPSYQWPNSDIALLQLDRDVNTSYAPLATSADLVTGQAATVYGWGSENADWSGPLPERLKYAEGQISDANCASATPRVLCTQTDGSIAGGDSGGPVWVRSAATGELVQGGVCALGHRPAGSGWAGYTNVALFRDWIRTTSGV